MAPNVVDGLTRDEHGFITSASQDLLSMSETGETLSDVPITRSNAPSIRRVDEPQQGVVEVSCDLDVACEGGGSCT